MDALGVTRQSVWKWDVIPAERCADIEAMSGIPRHKLRPDVFRKSGLKRHKEVA